MDVAPLLSGTYGCSFTTLWALAPLDVATTLVTHLLNTINIHLSSCQHLNYCQPWSTVVSTFKVHTLMTPQPPLVCVLFNWGILGTINTLQPPLVCVLFNRGILGTLNTPQPPLVCVLNLGILSTLNTPQPPLVCVLFNLGILGTLCPLTRCKGRMAIILLSIFWLLQKFLSLECHYRWATLPIYLGFWLTLCMQKCLPSGWVLNKHVY